MKERKELDMDSFKFGAYVGFLGGIVTVPIGLELLEIVMHLIVC